MNPRDLDPAVRLTAQAFLRDLSRIYGDLLPRAVLQTGFTFRGARVPLVGPQGIFKPAIIPTIPLTITTAPPVEGKPRPYEDAIRYDGLITYRYRGMDPGHRENAGLRQAMLDRVPLIYFQGIAPGWYLAVFPVYIVGDDRKELAFTVAVDDPPVAAGGMVLAESDIGRRRYIARLIQQRLHQAEFRHKVIRAYRTSCAVCSLHDHPELLDAAHILPDGHPRGAPVLPNGLSLCKLHHAAVDSNLIGIRPDYVVEVRDAVLEETDGPMLLHGLQGMNRRRLLLPGRQDQRPDPELLEERYEEFRRTG